MFSIISISLSLVLIHIYSIQASTHKCPSLHPPRNLPEKSKPLPLVIGHRGASYHVPEHTLASYRLALELGADYIEPDLVPTKDNVLIAVHSLDLNLTTDVEKKFPDRVSHNIEGLGSVTSGYLTTDFTLDEIKTLRVRQRVEDTPARSRYFDYQHTIPTFQEILNLVMDWNLNVLPYIDRSYSNNTNTTINNKKAGVYVELKYPNFIQSQTNRSISDLFIQELTDDPAITDFLFSPSMCENLKFDEYVQPPLIIQSFDSNTLKYLFDTMETNNVFNSSIPPMVKLVQDKQCRAEEFWFELSQEYYIEGIGPDKNCILNAEDSLGFVQEAIKRNLVVHPWTERLEIEFIDEKFNNAEEELTHLFCDLKVHGMFFENVGLGRKIVEKPCDLAEEIKLEKEGNVDIQEEEKIAEAICDEKVGADFMGKTFLTITGLFVGGFLGSMITTWTLKRESRHMNKMRTIVPQAEDKTPVFQIADGNPDNDNEIL